MQAFNQQPSTERIPPQLERTSRMNGLDTVAQRAANQIVELAGPEASTQQMYDASEMLLAKIIKNENNLSAQEVYRLNLVMAKISEYYKLEAEHEKDQTKRESEIVMISPTAATILGIPKSSSSKDYSVNTTIH